MPVHCDFWCWYRSNLSTKVGWLGLLYGYMIGFRLIPNSLICSDPITQTWIYHKSKILMIQWLSDLVRSHVFWFRFVSVFLGIHEVYYSWCAYNGCSHCSLVRSVRQSFECALLYLIKKQLWVYWMLVIKCWILKLFACNSYKICERIV